MRNSSKYLYLSTFFIPLIYLNNVIDINVLHGFIFSLIAVLFLIYRNSRNDFKLKLPVTFLILLLLFAFVTALSGFINGYSYQTLPYLSWLFLIGLMIVIYSCNISDEKKFSGIVLTIISISIFIFCIIGIFQILGVPVLDFRETLSMGSTLNLRNSASEFVAICTPVTFYKILTTNSAKKYFFLTSFFVCISYLIMLRTRSGIFIALALSMFIIILTVFVFRQEMKFRFNIMTIIFIIAGVSFVVFTSTLSTDEERSDLTDTMVKSFDIADGPNIGRIHFVKSTFEIFSDSPVIGNGAGSFYSNFRKYNRYMSDDTYIKNNNDLNPHSLLLEILNDTGATGVIIFFTSLILFARKIYRDVKFNLLNFILVCTFAAGLVLMFVSFAYKNIAFLMIFTFVTGRLLSQMKFDFELNSSYVKSAIVLISLFVLIISGLRFFSEYHYLKALGSSTPEESVSHFDKIFPFAYPVDPNQIPPQHYLTSRLIEVNRAEDALGSALIASEVQPYYAPTWNNIASLYYSLGRKQAAVEKFHETKNVFRNYIEPQINLMALHVNEGELLKAKEIYYELSRNNELVSKASNYNYYLNYKNAFNE